MIIEDDEDLRLDLAELLRMEGYTVETAGNGREALDHLVGQLRKTGTLPCVILLDLMMPVMNGWDFRAEQLRVPKLASVPVLVLSGAADVAEQATGLHAAGYLTKPVEIDDLCQSVEKHCC